MRLRAPRHVRVRTAGAARALRLVGRPLRPARAAPAPHD
jgi:hypothetical protein